MKPFLYYRYFTLGLLCLLSYSRIKAQITPTVPDATAGTTTSGGPTMHNISVNAANACPVSINFSSGAGISGWTFIDAGIDAFPGMGRISFEGTTIVAGTTHGVGSPITIVFTPALGDGVGTVFGFEIQQTGEPNTYITITIIGGCPAAPALNLSIVKTAGDECTVPPPSTMPTYSITVSDGKTAGTRNYNLSLSGTALGFGFAGGTTSTTCTLSPPTNSATVPLGGQTPSGTGSFNCTVSVTDSGGNPGVVLTSPPPAALPAPSTIQVNNSCCQALGNALVVMVNDDTPTPPVLPAVGSRPIDKMTDVSNWLAAASFGNAVFTPFQKTGTNPDNAVDLPLLFNTYSDITLVPSVTFKTPLLDLVQDALIALACPGYLNNVKYLMLFLNTTNPADVGPSGYWAVQGPLTYHKPGGGKITLDGVSIHMMGATKEEIAHGVGHMFGFKDLNVFDLNTGAFQPIENTPTGWDNMAVPTSGFSNLQNVQPLVEHKKFANNAWVDFSTGSPRAQEITSTTATSGQIIAASAWTSGVKTPVALALTIPTDPGNYVWIEARPYSTNDEVGTDPSKTTFDGIVVYYANNNITNNGGGRIQGYSITADPDFPFSYPTDTFLRVAVGTTGWTITGLSKDTGTGVYTVNFSYTSPSALTYNAYNRPGPSYSWLSPDIETDIPGYADPTTSGENPGLLAGDIDTKVIATVRNSASFPVDVYVKFSISRGTVTGATGFSEKKFASVFTTIPAASGGVDGMAKPFAFLNLRVIEGMTWGPTLIAALSSAPSSAHYCLFAEIVPITPGEFNSADNKAQKNSGFIPITHSSPYPAFDYTFYASNPDDKPRTILFNTMNVPGKWQFKLTPNRVYLGPREEKEIKMHIEVPADFPDCTNFPIQISASMLAEHTLIPLSGIMPYIQLRETTDLNATVKIVKCTPDSVTHYVQLNKPTVGLAHRKEGAYTKSDYGNFLDYLLKNIIAKDGNKKQHECATLIINGCTNPPRPNEKITIAYQDPAGNPIFKEVTTNAQGCFTDQNVVVEGGEWKTTAIYPGNGCYGSTKEVIKTVVPILQTGDQDSDGRKDEDEIQGDEDGDGIPNQLDPDSDNDGILDGDEPLGNYDCDSYDNMIDPDSDDDGTPDGQDKTPYGNIPSHRVFLSALYHRFDFDSDLPIKDGSGFNLRAGYNLHPKWAVEGELGITSTEDLDSKSGKVYNVNVNGLYYFLNRPAVSPYVTAGLGALLFKDFSNDASTFAVNAGVGAIATYPNLLPGFALRAEVKGHYGFSGYNTDGNLNLQYSVGVLYRFRTQSTPCNIDRRIKESRRK